LSSFRRVPVESTVTRIVDGINAKNDRAETSWIRAVTHRWIGVYYWYICSLLTCACPVRAAASQTEIKELQTLQHKLLRMSLKAPWFVRNKHLHNDTGLAPTNRRGWLTNLKTSATGRTKPKEHFTSKSAKTPPNQD